MTDKLDRTKEIAENLNAERLAITEIQRRTGIELTRLQFISKVGGADRERIKPVAAEMVERERNAVTRANLYTVFGSPANDEFLAQCLEWHRAEEEDQATQILERVILAHAKKVNRNRICSYLMLSPSKLKIDALRFLVRQGRTDDQLMLRLRNAYEHHLYDLEVLSVIANMYGTDYAAVVGLDGGSDRLSGSQCHSLLRYQLPANEYGFRRADLVPYYARIVASAITDGPPRCDDLKEFCEEVDGGFVESVSLYKAVRSLATYECIPLVIKVLENAGIVRAVVLSLVDSKRDIGGKTSVLIRRRSADNGHRRRSPERYWIAMLEAPIPPSWNLFPKRLLPPDDPLRFVRPG